MAGDSLLAGKKIEIPEIRYSADLELHDRFLNLSGEFVRLSLAGMAVTGGFLAVLAGENAQEVLSRLPRRPFSIAVAISLVSFALSVVAALFQRFFASQGMYHHFRAIKLLILIEQPAQNPTANVDPDAVRKNCAEDERLRDRQFVFSGAFLWGSALLLVVASSMLGGAFFMLLGALM